MVRRDRLIDDDLVIFHNDSMGYLLHSPYVQVDKELIISLIEILS